MFEGDSDDETESSLGAADPLAFDHDAPHEADDKLGPMDVSLLQMLCWLMQSGLHKFP